MRKFKTWLLMVGLVLSFVVADIGDPFYGRGEDTHE